MINGIIFSKDRAAQLQLLLYSLKKNATNIFDLKVIYKSSQIQYELGFEKLMKQYPEVKWIKESSNFKEDVLSEVNNTESDYTCFFTDDDIVYKKLEIEDLTLKLKEDNNAFCFSLRLGKNTTYCYAMNADNEISLVYDDHDFISWNWQTHSNDFGYPLSVDGHVFRTKEILALTEKVDFHNPNTFEAALQIFSNYPKKYIWAFAHSVLVNSPSNRVQDAFQNRVGEEYGVSPEELNDTFLSGQEIDFAKIDFSNIIGCHQELEFSYSKK